MTLTSLMPKPVRQERESLTDEDLLNKHSDLIALLCGRKAANSTYELKDQPMERVEKLTQFCLAELQRIDGQKGIDEQVDEVNRIQRKLWALSCLRTFAQLIEEVAE